MYLLDTDVFLWWMVEPDQLSKKVFTIIKEMPDSVLFSSISAWEIAIKTSLGKLSGVPLSGLADAVLQQRFVSLSFTVNHAIQVHNLPHHHADPFDRALVAQAQTVGVKLITRDPQIAAYEIEIVW